MLSGRGALYLSPSGNRYNVVLQQASYVCNDLEVAVAEFGYYAARDWHERLALLTEECDAFLREHSHVWSHIIIQPQKPDAETSQAA